MNIIHIQLSYQFMLGLVFFFNFFFFFCFFLISFFYIQLSYQFILGLVFLNIFFVFEFFSLAFDVNNLPLSVLLQQCQQQKQLNDAIAVFQQRQHNQTERQTSPYSAPNSNESNQMPTTSSKDDDVDGDSVDNDGQSARDKYCSRPMGQIR